MFAADNLLLGANVFIGAFFGILSIPSCVICHELGHILATFVVCKVLKQPFAPKAYFTIYPKLLHGITESELETYLNTAPKKHAYIVFIYALGPAVELVFLGALLGYFIQLKMYINISIEIVYAYLVVLIGYSFCTFWLDKSPSCDRKMIKNNICPHLKKKEDSTT